MMGLSLSLAVERTASAGMAATSLPLQGNLVFKLSADSLALSNGATVAASAWEDSINNITLDTQIGSATQTFQTNVTGGKPCVRFVGTGNLAISVPGALKTAVDSQICTVLIVCKNSAVNAAFAGNSPFAASAGGNSFFYYADGWAAGRYDGTGAQGFVPKYSGNAFFTMGSVSGLGAAVGINTEHRFLNGTAYYTNVGLVPAASATFGVGGFGQSLIFPFIGDIYEILVWNVALTPAQYMQAEKWVREKYSQPYPWAGVSKLPVFFGDSITANLGETTIETGATYLAAQTLGLTYGQYQALGIGGLSMNQMTTLAPTYINPIVDQFGGKIGVTCWEWANQRDATTTAGALMLAALKAKTGLQTVFGTSTSATLYDNSADRATFNAAWNVIGTGVKTNIDAYMPIHSDTHIGVDGSYATFSTPTGGDGLHLTDATYPYLAALYSTGFNALPP